MANTKSTQNFAPSREHALKEQNYKLTSNSYVFKDVQPDDFFQGIQELPTIGYLLKKARSRHNLTQSALSELTGVTTTEICRLEANKTLKPSKEVLISLAPYLGYSYTYLLLCAGYSGVFNKEIYYNKLKEPILYTKIIADIYNADSELLELLSEINQLPLEDIQTLKKLIYVFKNIPTEYSDKPLINCIFRLFGSLKDFLNEQIENILKLLNIVYDRT